jgi:hypothetical protein
MESVIFFFFFFLQFTLFTNILIFTLCNSFNIRLLSVYMVGMSGDILPWIDHLLFKVLRSRAKINLSMLIKKKKKKKG